MTRFERQDVSVIGHEDAAGRFFSKKMYTPQPLLGFAKMGSQLPSPIYDDNPLFVRLYWKAWELGFRNFYAPAPQGGFVSQFIDAAFNKNF